MSDHVYKVVELVGSSSEGVDAAIRNAIARAGETLQHLDWFEVKEIRGTINEGQPQWFQVKVGVGFRVMEPADVNREA